MNAQEISKRLDELSALADELTNEIEHIKREKSTVRFDNTHVYFRHDRQKWIARWNSAIYNNDHIKQCDTKDEAVELACLYNDIAEFVLEAHREAGQ